MVLIRSVSRVVMMVVECLELVVKVLVIVFMVEVDVVVGCLVYWWYLLCSGGMV